MILDQLPAIDTTNNKTLNTTCPLRLNGATRPSPQSADLPLSAQPAVSRPKPIVVLVHGEWTDACVWRLVIPLLVKAGFPVIAPPIPLTSFEDDVVTIRRALAAQSGPLVVVGHSYGGAVITSAAAGNPQVSALVYIAGFAPDAGECVSDLTARADPTSLVNAVTQGVAGFLFLDRARFHKVFAGDLDPGEADVLAAMQKPIAADNLHAKVSQPAWREIPTWYLAATKDQAVSPKLQRQMANRMEGAKLVEVASGHLPQLSHATEVAKMIREAAQTVT